VDEDQDLALSDRQLGQLRIQIAEELLFAVLVDGFLHHKSVAGLPAPCLGHSMAPGRARAMAPGRSCQPCGSCTGGQVDVSAAKGF